MSPSASAALIIVYIKVVHPFFLQITDQAGPFYLTLSPADLDLDGDRDLLVHNMRKPGDFEAYADGAVWINQGGAQAGQVGRFTASDHDIAGSQTRTVLLADLDDENGALVYSVEFNGGEEVKVDTMTGTVLSGESGED